MWNFDKRVTSRDERAMETRKKILDEAKKLFAKYGYRNTSIHEITKGVNLSKGICYHYFPGGKLEMLHTLVNEGIDAVKNSGDEDLGIVLFKNGEPIPLKEALLLITEKAYEQFQKTKELALIVIYELQFVDGSKFTELLKNMFKKEKKFSLIEEYFSKLKERGEVRNLDYKLSFDVFMSTVMVSILYSNYTGIIDENYFKTLVSYFAELWLP